MNERTDTERLEWMENRIAITALKTNASVLIEADGGSIWLSGTFREAIDAAMDAEERG